MTAADLARIAEAITEDERTEQANWPLSRDRARGYIACRSTGNDCEYAGVSGSWQNQPTVRDPFPDKDQAEAFMDAQPAGRAVIVT